MTTQTADRPYVCTCGAAGCNTPEAMAERARLAAAAEAENALNQRAFALYVADRDDGLPLLTPDEYRARVLA